MSALSVTLITYNEENKIAEALESVKWADEIVVVDSFSTDRTLEICRRYTDKIYQIPWQGYVIQKNLALEKASHEWILNLDADERVSPELAEEIKRVLQTDEFDGYYIPRRVFYLGTWIRYAGWYPDYKLRLFKKSLARWEGPGIHEKVILRGKVGYLKGDLYHFSYNNLSHHIHKINQFTTIAAEQIRKPVRGYTIFLRALFAFFKKYFLKRAFLEGTRGLIISGMSAFQVFIKYAKMWELSQNPTKFEDTKTLELGEIYNTREQRDIDKE